MNWLYYLLESNLYLIIFYILYLLLFRRETYYQLNRTYLLASTVLAFIIPMLQIGAFKSAPQIPNKVFTIEGPYVAAATITQTETSSWSADNYYLMGYGIITLLLLAAFAYKIYKLIRLSRGQKSESHPDFKLIELPDQKDAFSFFNYLFIGKDLTLSSTIIRHEMIHIRQRHSLDIVYLELFKIVNWFNPVVYLLQNSMKEVHEFIADSESVNNEQTVSAYADFLLSNAYGIHSNTLTNTFFNKNLLKKRIMMLQQKRSGMAARLKFLLLMPLLAGLLCVSTLAFAKTYGWIDLAPSHPISSEVSFSPGSSKLLKIAQLNTTLITDKLSIHEKNGKVLIYTPNSLTKDDKVYLLNQYSIKVDVIEANHAGTNKLFKGLNIFMQETKGAGEKITSDESPAKKTDQIRYVIDPSHYTFKQLTDLTVKFYTDGYKMSFDQFQYNNEPMLKIALRKSDTKPGSEASATFRVNELIKGGYVIAIGVDKQGFFVHSEKINFAKPKNMQIGKQTDSTIKAKVNSANKQIDSAIKGEIKRAKTANDVVKADRFPHQPIKKTDSAVKEVKVERFVHQQTNKLPPPAGYFSGCRTLYAYLDKHIRYPAKYFEQKTVDNVIVEFTTGADHKISGVKIKNNTMPLFAEEVSRQMKTYTDTVNRTPGTYFFVVQFNLINEKHTQTWLPSDEYLNLTGRPDCAGNIEIVGFVKDE